MSGEGSVGSFPASFLKAAVFTATVFALSELLKPNSRGAAKIPFHQVLCAIPLDFKFKLNYRKCAEVNLFSREVVVQQTGISWE